jgi:hypothetical protein
MAPAGPPSSVPIYILKMVKILIHPIDQWSQMAQ